MTARVLTLTFLLLLSPWSNAAFSDGGATLPSGETTVGGGRVGEADDYFVDCAAADGGDGSLSTPWNDFGGVTGVQAGDDLYVKTNCTFSNQTVNLDWGDSSSDDVVFDCYYINGANAFRCTASQTQPTINGAEPSNIPLIRRKSASAAFSINSTATLPVTIPSGTSRLLLVGVAYEDATGSISGASLSDGSVLAAVSSSNSLGENHVRFFYLTDDEMPAAGDYTLTVTADNDEADNGGMTVSAIVFENAQQSGLALEEYKATATSSDGITDYIETRQNGYSLKMVSTSNGDLAHDHLPGSWTELFDLEKLTTRQTAATSAYKPTGGGEEEVTTSLSAPAVRIVQGVISVYEAPQEAQVAQGVFVDSSAPSGGNGTLASPYNSLSVATSGRSTGDDVWLKAGSVFDDQALTISWGGTTSNRAIVGCYYESGGAAYECTDAQTNPEINGALTPSCVNNKNCSWDQTQYQWQVQIQRSYVTVRNLAVRYVYGRCFLVDGDSDPSGNIVNPIIEKSVCEYAGFSGADMQDDVINGIYRDNTFRFIGACERQDPDGGAGCSLNTANPGGAPAGIVYARNREGDAGQRGLIENNLVYGVVGECVNFNRSSHIIVRGNRVGNCDRVGIYGNHAVEAIVENNILWANPNNANRWGKRNPFWGISFAIEPCPGDGYCGSGGQGHVVRNNIVLGVPTGVYVMGTGAAGLPALPHSGWIYGNTVFGASSKPIDLITSGTQGPWVVTNNIFYNSELSASSMCDANSESTFDHNLWSSSPSDSDCVGANDVIGNPVLPVSIAQAQSFDYTDPPTIVDATPGAGSLALSAGQDASSALTVLATSNWSGIFDELTSFDGSGCDGAWYEGGLEVDFNCTGRPATPDIGAVETVPASN